MRAFTPEEHKLVSDAVAAAEGASDGEIVTIVAGRSDSYHDVGLHYAVLAMLLVPTIWAALPQSWLDWATAMFLDWNESLSTRLLLILLFAKMAFVFLVVRYALAWMPLRMALTPSSTKERRVRRRAIETFKAAAERRTEGRTGVLLYLSLLEHRAEIVADEFIHTRVQPEVWGEAMAVLIERVKAGEVAQGMALAVEKIGAVIAECAPPTGLNPNEIPDRLIEL